MNYIEEHGKKVAAVLCVASCFPVVAAVYAMETEPGWHGDRYINTDATVAVGWQEIEGKSYYFDESGEVDEETGCSTGKRNCSGRYNSGCITANLY